jgi:hypothetical protein
MNRNIWDEGSEAKRPNGEPECCGRIVYLQDTASGTVDYIE